MTWAEFKSQNKGWDYTSDPELESANRHKNIEIWSKIGKDICNYYTKSKNTIIYTEYKAFTLSLTHLILLLDDSGNFYYFLFLRLNELGRIKWSLKLAGFNGCCKKCFL
jgi:hypothetical protein